MTFDLNEGHNHLKLTSPVLLTKFGSYRALFNIFDSEVTGDPGPLSVYNFCNYPINAPDQVRSKSDHVQNNSNNNSMLNSNMVIHQKNNNK